MPIGATVACLLAGFLQDGLGRRITLIVASIVYMGSTILSFFANGFIMLAAGRLITGLAIGIFSSTVPMYISELSPPHLRGTLVTLNQVCICTGVLYGYLMDKLLTPKWRWEFVSGFPIAVLVFLAFIFITPFSPRWLMSRGRTDEARKVLMRIRGGNLAVVEDELQGISNAISLASNAEGRWAKLRERHVIWGIAIGVIAALMQQWCGVNAVNAYAQDIFAAAGFNTSDASTQAIYIGVAKLAFVIVALFLMDRLGRKPLLLIGCVGMAFSCVALALSFQLSSKPFPKSVGYTASASLILYMAFFEISLGPVLWLLLSELYPLQVKGVAMSVGSFTCWLMTYVFASVIFWECITIIFLFYFIFFFIFLQLCCNTSISTYESRSR
jgi:MFS transporter, SP family, galactose:H+ symporter